MAGDTASVGLAGPLASGGPEARDASGPLGEQASVRQLRLIGGGAWAVLDQGLFALSNFLVTTLLARWLEPADFGAYAAAYAVFLLLATSHTSLVTEPVLVHGSGSHRNRFASYLRIVLRLHWIVGAGIGLLLLFGGSWLAFNGRKSLGASLVALGITAPLLLLPWVLRRAHVACLAPRGAAAGGALYFGVVAVQLFLLRTATRMTVEIALGAMALASLVTGFVLYTRLQRGGISSDAAPSPSYVFHQHWEYGRWSILITALMWIPANLAFCLVPLWEGLESGGLLKALMNFAMPVSHATAAFGSLLIPGFVRARASGGTAAVRRAVLFVAALLVSGVLVYSALLAWGGPTLADWLYGGRYQVGVELFGLVGLLPLGGGLVVLLGAVLRSCGHVRNAVLGPAVAALVMLTIGAWMIAVDGVRGAFIGYLAATLSAAAVMAWTCRRILGRSGETVS